MPKFNLKVFLSSVGPRRSAAKYKPKKFIFRQGDPADSVFFIQSGKNEISVISKHGREGVIAMLGAGDFFGKGCLAGQPLHMASAIALTESVIIRIEKGTMTHVLREEPALSEMFMAFLLSRNIQFEESASRRRSPPSSRRS